MADAKLGVAVHSGEAGPEAEKDGYGHISKESSGTGGLVGVCCLLSSLSVSARQLLSSYLPVRRNTEWRTKKVDGGVCRHSRCFPVRWMLCHPLGHEIGTDIYRWSVVAHAFGCLSTRKDILSLS